MLKYWCRELNNFNFKNMEDKIKEENKEVGNSNDWKGIVQSFVTNMVARASDNISEKIQKWLDDVKRKTAGAILVAVGSIFVLVSIAIYVNVIVDNGSQWAGYGVVGVIILLMGYIMSKK